MKLKLAFANGTPSVIIKYENNEWKMLEEKLIALELKKATTSRGMGNQTLTYYRSPDQMLYAFLQNELQRLQDSEGRRQVPFSNVDDDINTPLYRNKVFNIALFRIVPNEKEEISLKMDKYLTASEINKLVPSIKAVYEIMFSLITQDVEITFKTVEKKIVFG